MAVVNQSFPYFNLPTRKDFTKPLHVDCSVEYELPNSAKPPVGTKNEPLLMIHPSYYRREESQNRSPFVNNLPQRITNYMNTSGTGSTSRRQMRTATYSQTNAKTQITSSCNKTSSRAPLICSSNEAVNCNTDIGIFRRSPLTATNTDLTLHSDIQAVSDARYLTVMKDSKSFIADILPSVCQEVNKSGVATSSSSSKSCQNVGGNVTSGGVGNPRKQRPTSTLTNQQPAVGVAAVAASASAACAGCNPCLEGDPCAYLVTQHRRIPQQPWSGMTAPQFASFPTTGKYRKTLDSPAVVAAATPSTYNLLQQQPQQKRATPWSDSNVGTPAKRNKTAALAALHNSATDKTHTANLYSASANFSQWCNNILPNYTSSAVPSGADCCKVCQQQQWNYTSHCRAASGTTASSIIWNNENMLRLFQV